MTPFDIIAPPGVERPAWLGAGPGAAGAGALGLGGYPFAAPIPFGVG